MASPDFGELRRIKIDPELFSRGSGERILLHEAVVYDFMPKILGSRFAGVEELRRTTHFYSETGSFMMGEEAHQEVAQEELKSGNLVPALEAYKRSLHNAVGFVEAVSALGDGALLSPQEVNRLNLRSRFGALEDKLIYLVVSQNVAFDLPKYIEWLNNVRRLERDARRLNQQYFGHTPKYPNNDFPSGDPRIWERDTSLKDDLETGTKLRDTYARMQRYRDAAWISGKLGDSEGEAKFTELAKTDPVENTRYPPILYRIQLEYDKSRGYIK